MCHLNGLYVLDSMKPVMLNHYIEEVSPLALLFMPQQAMQIYVEHLQAEEKSNNGRFMVKMIYLAGILLSIIATLYILDKYAKKQMAKMKAEDEEDKKLEAQ